MPKGICGVFAIISDIQLPLPPASLVCRVYVINVARNILIILNVLWRRSPGKLNWEMQDMPF